MSFLYIFILGCVLNSLVVAGGVFAYRNKMFFLYQLHQKGLATGFPFALHGAMWSDLLIISPICLAMCAQFGAQWNTESWLISGCLGMIASLLLHYGVYLRGSLPGSHGWNGRMTVTGFVHLIYTAIILQIAALFFFLTAGIQHSTLLLVSVVFTLHILTGLVPQVWASVRHPDWFTEKPHKQLALWLSVAAIWGFIAWRTAALW